MTKILFAYGYINHFKNYSERRQTKALNELVDKKLKELKPSEDHSIEDIVILKEQVVKGYNAHKVRFQFKFKFTI